LQDAEKGYFIHFLKALTRTPWFTRFYAFSFARYA